MRALPHEWLQAAKKGLVGGWARWLTPVIPSTLGGRGSQMTKSGVRDQSGQHSETLSLLKIQKLAGHRGTHL